MRDRLPQIESNGLIDQLLKNRTGDALNICAEAYDIIMASSDSSAVFRHFCNKDYPDQSADKEPVVLRFSDEQKMELVKRKGALVDGFFEAILQENLEEELFYMKLWQKITTETLLPDAEDKIFALFFIWIDNRIPYFKLGQPLILPDNEIASYVDKLETKLNKARFIICAKNRRLHTKASYVLEIMNEIENHQEKAVFLSIVFNIIHQIVKAKGEQKE
ncbi:MAG: hypothetical protein SCM11_04465 [Bacillota bacterium]|nr:hypothetical protein [Bacillota bacterium]